MTDARRLTAARVPLNIGLTGPQHSAQQIGGTRPPPPDRLGSAEEGTLRF